MESEGVAISRRELVGQKQPTAELLLQLEWGSVNMADFREIDPRELRLPPSRRDGADSVKLARQIALFGPSILGMPPPWVYEGNDGILVIYNGVTRATRVAQLAPGTRIRVEVIGKLPKAFAKEPKIGDLVP